MQSDGAQLEEFQVRGQDHNRDEPSELMVTISVILNLVVNLWRHNMNPLGQQRDGRFHTHIDTVS